MAAKLDLSGILPEKRRQLSRQTDDRFDFPGHSTLNPFYLLNCWDWYFCNINNPFIFTTAVEIEVKSVWPKQ